MDGKVVATYQGGLLVLEEPLDLPEGARVEVTLGDVVALPEHVAEDGVEPNGGPRVVGGPHIIPPSITDPEERARRLAELVERMRNNPIPLNAPRFTRDELHERD